MASHLTGVTAERYPCNLAISDPEPVLAYLARLADEPLTARRTSAARDFIQAKIHVDGNYPIRKHTVLITAAR